MNVLARLAIEMFCYSVRKQIAAMVGDLRRLVLDRCQPRRSAE